MKLNFKVTIIFLIVFLIFLNIYLFTQSLFLGDNILKIEKEISKLKLDNSKLEKKLFSLTSLQNLIKESSLLGFTKESEPIYLDNLKYASRQ
jgi:cell division protein FtsL